MNRESDEWFGFVPDAEPTGVTPDYGVIEVGRGGVSASDVEQLVAGTERRRREVRAYLASLESSGALSKRAVVQYRCRSGRGCDLGRLVSSPMGLILALPAFRLSPERNASTSVESRASHTSDGDRRWQPNSDVLPSGGVEPLLRCDHVDAYPVTAEQMHRDAETRPPRPILIPRDTVR